MHVSVHVSERHKMDEPRILNSSLGRIYKTSCFLVNVSVCVGVYVCV